MAVPPPPKAPHEVIDLTEDDNVTSASRASQLAAGFGISPINTHHGRHTTANVRDDSRPAKRVKVAHPPANPLLRLSEPMRTFATQTTDETLRRKPYLSRTQLQKKLADGLLQKFGSNWPSEDGDISMGELRDICNVCDELVAQLDAPPATQNSTPAPSPHQPNSIAKTNGSIPKPNFIDLTDEDGDFAPIALSPAPAITRPSPAAPPVSSKGVPSKSASPTATPTPSVPPLPTVQSTVPRPNSPQPRKHKLQEPFGTPKAVKKARTVANAQTSPQNFRSRAKKAAWQSDLDDQDARWLEKFPTSTYFKIKLRPYLDAKTRDAIMRSNGRLSRLKTGLLQKPEIFHVDFTLEEARDVRNAVLKELQRQQKHDDPFKDLTKLLHKLKPPKDQMISVLAKRIAPHVNNRRREDLLAFFKDLFDKRPLAQQSLSLVRDPYDKRAEDLREARLSSLLLARETSGGRFGSTRRLENFTNEFRKCLEDGLEIRSEFTNCAGDISTISWVSNKAYVAGTTVHMDAHNQQYNKPGNLVLGSIASGSATVKAYPDHRIVRPIVEKGENSTAAMRASQDPWLYTSVVSSDYDPIHDRAYTSGFDKKVKVWSVDESGASMSCLETWNHDGNVNFVQASAFRPPGGTHGFVATAADSPVDAVRIYSVFSDVVHSTFRSFSCSRILNADDTPVNVDKWTYFPSTMKWGIEDSVKSLLLVGYSPRSRTDDDRDIPADRINTGELCLWDAYTGQKVLITSTKTQNIFEVLWHPTQAVFVAATSPIMLKQDANIQTQVRIFSRTEFGHFSEVKTLDCMASDINELTVVPNCEKFCYVTAGCTDGNTYVWDTAISDKPIHVLAHGPAVEGVRRNDDEDDTGVKFTAWGSSLDRFYTGSSDGVVKLWNIRTSGKSAKGRVVLEAPAQISFGAFSPDKSRLVIGDASGRIFVLSVEEEDGKPASFTDLTLPGPGLTSTGRVKRRRPNPITPHKEPPPPSLAAGVPPLPLEDGHAMVVSEQLRHSGDPTVGMVQGPNYTQLPYVCREAHNDFDPSHPLIAHFTVVQQEQIKRFSGRSANTQRLASPWDSPNGPVTTTNVLSQHSMNRKLDLRFENLSLETRNDFLSLGDLERQLEEEVDYGGLEEEEDEINLRGAKCEVVRDHFDREERFWV